MTRMNLDQSGGPAVSTETESEGRRAEPAGNSASTGANGAPAGPEAVGSASVRRQSATPDPSLIRQLTGPIGE